MRRNASHSAWHMVRVVAIACVIALLACSVLALSGCRFSEALAELVIDPYNGEYDPDLSPEYQNVDDAEEDSTRASTTKSDTDNEADQEQSDAVYDEDEQTADDDEEAAEREHADHTNEDTDASEGDEPDEDSDDASSSGESSDGDDADSVELVADDESDGDELGDVSVDADPTESGDADSGTTDSGDGDAAEDDVAGQGGDSEESGVVESDDTDSGNSSVNDSSGRGGTGATYGQDGTYDELPMARAIAATGQYALITQMIAGEGGLAAADEEWLSQIQQTDAFAGEGLEEVLAAWSGDGTASGSLDIDALIDTHADVVLLDGSAVTLTDDEVEQLHEAGISTVYVPVLGQSDTSDDDIVTAVQVVAQLLSSYKSEAKYDTAEMSEIYVELHDQTIDDCLSANGGYSYKVTDSKQYTRIYQGTGETGIATSNLSDVRITTAYVDALVLAEATSVTAERSYGIYSLYLDGLEIDISDGVGLSTTVTSGNYALMDYYLQVSGVVNNAYDTARPTSSSGTTTLPYAVVAGKVAASDVGISLGVRSTPSALWYAPYGTTMSNAFLCVGDDDFPGIIVRSESIANVILTSANKVDGLYNVGQPYSIWVVPEGIAGSWADGTVESFLLSTWAYGVFQDGNTSSCDGAAEEFYETFYRIDDAADGDAIEGYGTVLTTTCPTS